MIEHDVVLVGGVEYKAVSTICDSCCGCVGRDGVSCDKFRCFPEDRGDKLSVIYKRHYRPKHNEFPIKVIEL